MSGYCIWKSMLKIAKRKPSKSEVTGEKCWINSRVILLVGTSQGLQDAASLKGKMLPISWSGVARLHTRPGLLVMAAKLGPRWVQGTAKQELPQMPLTDCRDSLPAVCHSKSGICLRYLWPDFPGQ